MGDALNQDLSRRARFSLSQLALAVSLTLSAGASHALGLGRLNVQSALGETLRAEIEITSLSADEANSLRVRLASPDVYRSNGLDYNAVLSGTQVQAVKRADGRTVGYTLGHDGRAHEHPAFGRIYQNALSWILER